ncbi:slipin family protein [Reichenbachiella ulvae]|uniref:Slipin family protein n=1 Tax=Reichenbachiella ulvae TaxID=2980104 RepID=A0ABT3CQP3_9BACT|nr:slipin family protein [Reichenbachiella ulvae]MCV9386036.1 slipin family protein [Reichenbachiella ulvae]
MKRIRISAGNVGLVFKNGDYKRVLTAGLHWIGPFETFLSYDMAQPFYPSIEINVLLKDEKIAALLHLIEVGDNEMVLLYRNGNFSGILGPGRFTYWKGLVDYRFTRVDLSKIEITEAVELLALKRKELVPYVRICKVDSFEKGVLFVDNKMDRILDPGEYYFWKNAQEVAVSRIDLRQQQLEVSGQEILTKDKAALRLNFFAQFRVIDIEKAIVDNKDYERQLYIFLQLALREYVGSLTFDQLLENKEEVGDYVMSSLKTKSLQLGVEIMGCGVRDIILPGEMKEIMNQVLIAQKQAQANVITRREETASTRSLLNTAKLLSENEMLFKLKEMEYVEKIADKIGEITVSGNGQIVDQLRGIFSPNK